MYQLRDEADFPPLQAGCRWDWQDIEIIQLIVVVEVNDGKKLGVAAGCQIGAPAGFSSDSVASLDAISLRDMVAVWCRVKQ